LIFVVWFGHFNADRLGATSGWWQLAKRIAAFGAVAALFFSALVASAAPAAAVIEPTACKISAPVSPAFHDPDTMPFVGDPDFVQYQATDGHGTYAGIAKTVSMRGPTFRVIRYSSGHITVLDTLVYLGVSFQPIDGSVKVVGIDGFGNVIVRVQRPGTWLGSYLGYRYDRAGHRSLLQDSPLWTSFSPVGVTPTGVVAGFAQYRGAAGNRIVEWTGAGRGTIHLLSAYLPDEAQALDRRGDIFYGNTVRLNNGQTVKLTTLGNLTYLNLQVHAASTNAGFGTSQYGNGSLGVRWIIPSVVSGSGTVQISPTRVGYLVWINAAGAGGDVVGDYPGNSSSDSGTRVLVTRTGKAYRLPPQFKPKYNTEPSVVIDDYGQVMYTGTDALPHLLSCPM
jgi:hypothetical protein